MIDMTTVVDGVATLEPEVVDLPAGRVVVGLRERVSMPELAAFFGRSVPVVLDEIFRQGIEPSGPPIAIYLHEAGQVFEVTVGFPVDEPEVFRGALVIDELPQGRAVRAVHIGPYETLPETYAALGRWFTDRQVGIPRTMWEEYLEGPEAASGPSQYRTRVVYPLGQW